jgi:hypothetical protein
MNGLMQVLPGSPFLPYGCWPRTISGLRPIDRQLGAAAAACAACPWYTAWRADSRQSWKATVLPCRSLFICFGRTLHIGGNGSARFASLLLFACGRTPWSVTLFTNSRAADPAVEGTAQPLRPYAVLIGVGGFWPAFSIRTSVWHRASYKYLWTLWRPPKG